MAVMEMDQLSELASEIVERHWNKLYNFTRGHSFYDTNGDLRYVEEAQDEFNKVLDLLDEHINGEDK